MFSYLAVSILVTAPLHIIAEPGLHLHLVDVESDEGPDKADHNDYSNERE